MTLLELYVSDAVYVTSLTFGTLIVGAIAYIFSRHLLAKRKLQLSYESKKEQLERNALSATIEIHETTLKEISENIHDDIGLKLTLLKLYLNDKKYPGLADCSATLCEVIQHLRNLSHDLSANQVKVSGLGQAIKSDLDKIRKHDVIKVSYDVTDDFVLDYNIEIILFRIYQETIQNIIKHSHANEISITLSQNTACFVMQIKDNGIGFSEMGKQGQGLRTISERIKSIDGTLNIVSDQRGTALTIHLPVLYKIEMF